MQSKIKELYDSLVWISIGMALGCCATCLGINLMISDIKKQIDDVNNEYNSCMINRQEYEQRVDQIRKGTYNAK